MKHFVYSLIALLQIGFLCNAAQVGFNRVGYVANIPNNSLFYNSVALQPDGKIVAVGGTDEGNGLIVRFNANGSPDLTFGTNGSVTNIPNTSLIYRSVALQPDRKIVAVGETDEGNGLIVRFNADGSPDLTFGNNGSVTNIPNTSFAYYSVALQADGKIFVVGETDDDNGLIARFNADGTLDQTFNGTGFITNIPNNSFSYNSVALQPDGKIVAVGGTDRNNGNQDGLIARFNDNGSLDTNNFGINGVVTNIPNNSQYYYSVALQGDGKIVAVGETDEGNGLIVRFNANGSPDLTFGTNGSVTNIPNTSLIYRSVALQPDGKIVAVGGTDDPNGLIARFNTDGTLDQTFNGTGFITNIPNNSFSYNSVALQPDGKIVAVGLNLNPNGIIARFLSNGVLDAESNWNLQNFRESNNINKVSIGLLG